MKKSLIALAVLAASGAAMAQSTVTLYGTMDLWVGPVKSETGGVSTTVTNMVSGGLSTPNWGIKGSEDLGGGLKANFQLEQGISADTGVATNFARKAFVGFSGGFGEVKLGLVPTPYDNFQGASDAVWDSDLSPANAPSGFNGTGVMRTSNDANGKVGNNIYYQSPAFAGFTGHISYALDENTNFNATNVATPLAITSLALVYAAGPLGVQFAYQKEDKGNTSNDLTYTRLGASYDFGVVVAKATYGKVTHSAAYTGAGVVNSSADGSTTEWQIGADVPVSAALTLSASYAKSVDNAAASAVGIGEVKRSGVGLGAGYSLSKRTTLYGGYKRNVLDNGSAADTTVSAFAVGVKHTF